jgi:hypothetical protein
MISDLEIYRATKMLIERHGKDAAIEAARLVDRALERGDRDGQLVWLRIKRAIEVLQAPPSGVRHCEGEGGGEREVGLIGLSTRYAIMIRQGYVPHPWVADQAAREADQDRREDHAPRALRGLPDWPRSRCRGRCLPTRCRQTQHVWHVAAVSRRLRSPLAWVEGDFPLP